MNTPCSQTSLEVAEPMAGTACAQTLHWIGLEYARPWRPKGVTDTDLSEPVADWLRSQAASPETRPLLLRQRGRKGRALIYANLQRDRVHRFELDRYRDLLDLPWRALRAGATDEGLTHEQPIFVCTHSARDHCCGLHGAGVARELCKRAGDRVWQCSHLGGHRFAATLVALPHGIHFGRVRASDAESLLHHLDSGRLFDLAKVRGQVRYSAAEQAACLQLRRETGDLGVRAFDRVTSTQGSDAIEVAIHHRGQLQRFSVTKQTTGPSAPPSCGASPAPVHHYVVRGIE